MKTTKDEQVARLAGILDGPWTALGDVARQVLALSNGGPDSSVIDVESWYARSATPDAVNADRRLAKILRPHWESAITDPGELTIRDSFDELLTGLQLVETAIETGYLDVTETTVGIADNLRSLLWSRSARRWLLQYEYYSVIVLSDRLGLDLGFRGLEIPEINRHGELQFAAFNNLVQSLYDNTALDYFLKSMDDYEFSDKSIDAIWNTVIRDNNFGQAEFLANRLIDGRNPTQFQHRVLLLTGGFRFVETLTRFLNGLPEGDIERFGSFFAYWLRRFFGPYKDRANNTRKLINWSEKLALLLREMQRHGEQHSDYLAYTSGLFLEEAAALRSSWEIIESFVHRQARTCTAVFPSPISRGEEPLGMSP